MKHLLLSLFGVTALLLFGCGTAAKELDSTVETARFVAEQTSDNTAIQTKETTPVSSTDKDAKQNKNAQPYSLEQAISDNA